MPQVVRTDIDDLNIKLSLKLTKEDYEPKFKSELNKMKGKANMKGFRKGKTPVGLLKKMYGKSVLVEVINRMVSDEIMDYIRTEEIINLGQPIPSEDQPTLDFDVNNMSEMEFNFDLGISPKIELKGLDSSSAFELYKVNVSDARIDEEIESGRKRGGQLAPIEDEMQAEDTIRLNVEELENGALKTDGWASTFSVIVNDIADETLRNEVLTKKKGDKFNVNVFTLEKDRTSEFVRKYILNVGENDQDVEIGEEFEATIDEVSRIKPADLDQEFFDRYFGPDKVSSEQEMRDLLKSDFEGYYVKQAESLMYRDFNKMLIDENDMPLPDDFLKRWLKTSNPDLTEDKLENEYEEFTKSLKWSLVRGELIKKYNLEVSDDELFEGVKEKVRGLFAQFGQAQVDELVVANTANRMMENEEEVNNIYRDKMNEKIMAQVRELVTVTEKPIGHEEFEEIYKKVVEEHQAEQAAIKAKIEGTPESSEELEEPDESDEEIAENVEEW